MDFDLKKKNIMVWYHHNKKRTTKDLLELSISWLKKEKYLQKNTKKGGSIYWTRTCGGGKPQRIGAINFLSNFIGENHYIELMYSYNGSEPFNCRVQIASTKPNYGGERYWFVCPRCGRKVAFLYGAMYFLCRHCHNLTYKTQQVGFMDRMLELRNKYQNKVDKGGCKRRWVHWCTYHKLMDKADYYEYQALISMHKKLKKRLY